MSSPIKDSIPKKHQMRGKLIIYFAGIVFILIALGFAGWWMRGYMSVSAILIDNNEPIPRWAFDNQDSIQHAVRWGLLAIPLGIIGIIFLIAGFVSSSNDQKND